MPGALLTDLYELNMVASYLRRGMVGSATFSLYVRTLPAERGFLVAAGLDACLTYLEQLSFEEDELAYLASEGFDDRAIEDFRGLRFTGEVDAVPEGRIVYAEEPILEVIAPIAEAQLVETYLLNQVTLHTTIASKAARFVVAARGRDLVDFAFRRTFGAEAAMAVARDSAIAGFAGTSNVEAARRYGLRVAGTMAHAFVEAFPTERGAFEAFARDHPGRTTFLVDTYDSLGGVANAIAVIRDLGLEDRLGVRLDSGDIDGLARASRRMLDDAGLAQARIFASGALDELDVDALVRAGAPVDAFGIGTKLGVSADAPSVDSVYKLVEYDRRPVLKLSAAKATLPGPKQVWRGAGHRDTIALRDEPGAADAEPLLEPVMRDGRRLGPPPSLDASRRRFATDLDQVPDEARRLIDPVAVTPARSHALEDLTRRTREEALRAGGGGAG
jgi:nicotinate phosphoribosyltransferase